jgi:hypothetical protein
MDGVKINMKYYKDTDNNIYAYELDGSQDHLIGNKLAITEEEVTSIHNQKNQDALDQLTYSEQRSLAYASIEEQLDMQYWDRVNGTSTWKEHIDAVKTAHPKPTE